MAAPARSAFLGSQGGGSLLARGVNHLLTAPRHVRFSSNLGRTEIRMLLAYFPSSFDLASATASMMSAISILNAYLVW